MELHYIFTNKLNVVFLYFCEYGFFPVYNLNIKQIEGFKVHNMYRRILYFCKCNTIRRTNGKHFHVRDDNEKGAFDCHSYVVPYYIDIAIGLYLCK